MRGANSLTFRCGDVNVSQQSEHGTLSCWKSVDRFLVQIANVHSRLTAWTSTMSAGGNVVTCPIWLSTPWFR